MAAAFRPLKVIIQAVPQRTYGAPAFRLIAYEVQTTRTYNPRLFDTLDALLDATVPVISGLRNKIPQRSDESCQGVLFDQILWLTPDDVLRLGLTARTD